MVKMELKYELNHIYYDIKSSAQVDIGDTYSDQASWLELFAKSLALTSDLKRLPILRSLWVDKQVSRVIQGSMVASSVTHVQAVITIFNAEYTQVEIDAILNDLTVLTQKPVIWSGTVDMYYNAAAPVYCQETFCIPIWQLQGGLLLNNKITVNIRVLTNGAVAGTALPLGTFNFPVFMEIDWTPVTEEQFKNYILEHVYTAEGGV